MNEWISSVSKEQVSVLWGELLNNYKIKIHFAHTTCKWSNEAKGKAAVYCVIIGFANFDTNKKRLFTYVDIKGEPDELIVKNINPYLTNAKDLVITRRSKPINDVPNIYFGNQPNAGGGFLLTEEEYLKFIQGDPESQKYIRQFVGSRELINNIKRYCLWLKNITPTELRKHTKIRERVEIVKEHRLNSKRSATKELANTPTLFGFVSHTDTEYIIIPSVSSEKRKYTPIDFMPQNVIASNLCLIIPNAGMFHFGILTSKMHMAWVKYTCGRLKSDYRYSNKIVYNNYPWPKELSEKNKQKVEEKAQKVLDARAAFPNSSLADLYDPLTMPPKLVKAHQELDRAVDLCYRPQAFPTENTRIEFLFDLYNEYIS